MRRIGTGLVPWAVLIALGIGCFARLIADPSGLIADGGRPSIDFANHGDARPLGNDVTFVFLPHHLYVAKVLAEFGHLPAWDCTGFGGRPIIGNPQSGVFYPPVWIAWFFSCPATLGWLTVGHLLWGGLGLYVLARSQGLSRWPATVAAGVFQASPYLLAQTFEGHYPHVWAACWFPWAFWAHAQQREGQVRGLLAMPVILAMAYLTGHPQEWFLLVIALSLWVGADVFGLVVKGKEGRLAAAATVVRWASVLGVGLSLAAIELVPARELASLGSEEFSAGSRFGSAPESPPSPGQWPATPLGGSIGRPRRLPRRGQLLGVGAFLRPGPPGVDRGGSGVFPRPIPGLGLDHPGGPFRLVRRRPSTRALQCAVLGAAGAELVSRPGTFAVPIVSGCGDACRVRARNAARQTE